MQSRISNTQAATMTDTIKYLVVSMGMVSIAAAACFFAIS